MGTTGNAFGRASDEARVARAFVRLRPVLFAALLAWFVIGLLLRWQGREPLFVLAAPAFEGGGPAPGAEASTSSIVVFLPGRPRSDGAIPRGQEIRIENLLEGMPSQIRYVAMSRFRPVLPVIEGAPRPRGRDFDELSAWLVARAAATEPRAADGIVLCLRRTAWELPAMGPVHGRSSVLTCRPWGEKGPTGPPTREELGVPVLDGATQGERNDEAGA